MYLKLLLFFEKAQLGGDCDVTTSWKCEVKPWLANVCVRACVG